MDASTWIALGALLIQTGGIAFAAGMLFSRVKSLEERAKTLESKPPVTDTDCKQELAVLTTKFEGMEKLLEKVSLDLHEMRSDQLGNARRGRSATAA